MSEIKTLNPKDVKKIYFSGICGTGMAAVAGLCKKAGYLVSGSDQNVYPPMSTMLEELNIQVFSPYGADNVEKASPDVVVVANALSRGNVEVEHVLKKDLQYTSFPKLMGEIFLKSRVSLTVTGTHGKTTTSSLLTHVLHELGEKPSYMIGGIPKNFSQGFDLQDGKFFILEGDEYDTAFFDKGPKFLHYKPQFLIVNNIEYDHADIYPNVEAIKTQFVKVCKLVADPENIILNIDDAGAKSILSYPELKDIANRVTKVATLGKEPGALLTVRGNEPPTKPGELWKTHFEIQGSGNVTFETSLSGEHNIANIAHVVALIVRLDRTQSLRKPLNMAELQKAIASFKGVKRRLDHLGNFKGIDVYEDFAHHPTAVKVVIEGFRKQFPKRRLHVAFEPRNATSRRNVFQDDYVKTFDLADKVYLGQCPTDQRIAESDRMNTKQIAQDIGSKAEAFATNEDLMVAITQNLQKGDAIIFMSSGSFSGVQHKIGAKIVETVK